MIIFRKQMQRTFAAKALSIFISLSFLLSSVAPGYAQTALTPSMPAPSTLIGLSGAYTPVLVRAIEIDPKDPLHFGFIVDNGDTKLTGVALTKETEKLIRYFLASMTVPEKDMWVNLSPYEKDRIVPEAFGNTQMGRDLLAQDYILKQLSASLIYPEDNLGKKFWDKIYKKAYEKYGTTNIPVNTFNKVWIIPQKASVYESGNRVFVIDSELEVMMEEDFLALQKNTDVAPVKNEKQDIAQNKLASDIVREIILPAIKEEVNHGKNFANLRQIYNAMILATWYKKNLKESLLGKVYVDQNKIQGIELTEKNVKQKIYDQYVEAFKKGIYNFIKVEHDQYANKSIPRKYFSGGFSSLGSSTILRKETNPSPDALRQKGDVVNEFDIELNETKSGISASAITIKLPDNAKPIEIRDLIVATEDALRQPGIIFTDIMELEINGTPYKVYSREDILKLGNLAVNDGTIIMRFHHRNGNGGDSIEIVRDGMRVTIAAWRSQQVGEIYYPIEDKKNEEIVGNLIKKMATSASPLDGSLGTAAELSQMNSKDSSASAIMIPDELPKFNNGRQTAEYLIKNGADPDWLMGFYPGFIGFDYAVPSTSSNPTFGIMGTRTSKRYIARAGEVTFHYGWPEGGLPTEITIGDLQYAPPVIRLKLDEQTGTYKKVSSSVMAVLPRIDPTQTEAWKALKQLGLKSNRKNYDLRKLFDQDSNRVQKFLKELSPEFEVDFSKNLINDETLKVLLSLAKETKLAESIELMFTGAKINETENRAVLHTALRNVKRDAQGKLIAANGPVFVDGKDVMPGVIAVLEKMEGFVKRVQSGEWRGASGKKIKNIINVGIGGSSLGPKMVVEALRPYKAGDVDAYFLSNIDGNAAAELTKKLDPEETLVYVVSKTFTTDETMTNATTLKDWFLKHYNGDESVIAKHFVAVSTAKELVTKFGINPENMFGFWDWVGGRYSVWSAVGLSVATYIGFDNFLEFLQGAREADEHFRTQAFENNIPVLKGLLDVWYGDFLNAKAFAILPYDQNLSLFPEFSQQFFMESNGKYVDRNGKPVKYVTGLPRFGAAGTDGQHSFYQEIHQAPEGILIPADFIGVINPQNFVPGHHKKFFSNYVAQTEALAFGLTKQEALDALKKDPKNTDLEWMKILAQHKTFPGNRPTTSILIDRLTPRTLGNMVALYEHEIFTEGILLNIFSFDQWGVQLGKIVATDKVLPSLMDQGNLKNSGLSTSAQRVVQKFNENFKIPGSGSTAGSAIVIPQVSSNENAWGLIKKVGVALENEKKILATFDLDSKRFTVGSRAHGDELMALVDVARKVVMNFKDGSSLTFEKNETKGEWVLTASVGKDFESIEKVVVAPVATPEIVAELGAPDIIMVAPEVVPIASGKTETPAAPEAQKTPTLQSSVDIALISGKTSAVDALKEIAVTLEKIGKAPKIIFVGTNGFYFNNSSQGARLKLALKEAQEFKIIFTDETSITVTKDEDNDRWKITKVAGAGLNFVNKGALSDELSGIVKVSGIPINADEDAIKDALVRDNMALGITDADIGYIDYYEPGKKTPWGKELAAMPKNVKDPVVLEIFVKDGFVIFSRAKNAKSFQFLEQHMPLPENFTTPFAEETTEVDAQIAELAKKHNLSAFDTNYLKALLMQYLEKSYVPLSIGANFVPTAQMSWEKTKKDLAVTDYAIEIKGQGQYVGSLQDIVHKESLMNAGLATSMGLKTPKSTTIYYEDLVPGFDENGQSTLTKEKVLLLEQKYLREILRAGKLGGIQIEELINFQSRDYVNQFLDSIYLFDRVDHRVNAQKRTYRQVLKEKGIEILPMYEQALLPVYDITQQKLTDEFTAPGGHGVFGRRMADEILRMEVPQGKTLMWSITNADGPNNAASEDVLGYMAKENIGFAILSSTRMQIDAKGGIFGIQEIKDERGTKIRTNMMELAQAKDVHQEVEFEAQGLDGKAQGPQLFNTNIPVANVTLLQPFLRELEAMVGHEKYVAITSPTLIPNPKEKGDNKIPVIQLEGALCHVIENLDAFLRTTDDQQVKDLVAKYKFKDGRLLHIINFNPENRDVAFTPTKYSWDWVLYAYTDHYVRDYKTGMSINTRPGHIPGFDMDSYYADLQHSMDAFGGASVTELDHLTVKGRAVFPNTVLKGNVKIVNTGNEVLDLNEMLTEEKFPGLFDKGPLGMTDNGRLILDNVLIVYDGSSLKISKIDSGKVAGSAIVTTGEVKTKIDDLIGQLQGITKIELIRQHGEKITFKSVADFFETWDAQFSELEDVDMAQEFNRIVITLDGWADVNILLPNGEEGFRVSRADFARFTVDHSQLDLNTKASEAEKALITSKDGSAKKVSSGISRSRYLGGWKHLESTFENGQTTHILWTDKFTKQAWRFVEDGNLVNDRARNILARQEQDVLAKMQAPEVVSSTLASLVEDTDPQTTIAGWTSPHGKSLEEILNAIIKEYDIRGYDGGDDVNYPAQMDDKLLRWIGRGLGSGEFYSAAHGRTVSLKPGDTFVIAGDNGPTTQKVNNALIEGLRDTGVNVVDLGTVPSGLLYFNIKALNAQGGLYVTRSHVEVGTNGAKPVIGGITLYGEMLQSMKAPIAANLYRKAEKRGNLVKTNEMIAQAKKEYYAFLREEFGSLKATLDRRPMKIGVNFAGGSTAADPEVKKIFQELLGGHLVSVLRDQSDPWGKEGGLADSSRDDIKALAHPKANIIEYSMQHPDEVIFNFDLDADRVSIVWGGKLYLGDDMFLPVIEYQLTMAPDKEYYKEMFIDSRMKATVTDAVKSFGGISKKHPKGHSKVKASMDVALATIAQKEGQSVEEFLRAHPKFRMLQPEYSLHMFSSNKFGASIDDAVRFAFIWLEIFSAIKEKYNKPGLTLAEYAQDLEGQGMIKPIFQVKEQRTTINDAAKVPVMKRMAQKVKDYFSRHPEFKFESYSSWQDFQGSSADYVFVDIEGVYDFTTPLGHVFWGWSNTSPKIAYGVQADTVEKTRRLLEIVMSLLVQSRQETEAEMGVDLESISPVETSASQRLLNINREDLPKFEIKLKDQYPGDKLFEALTASSGIAMQQSSSTLGEKIDNDRLNQGFVSDDEGYFSPSVISSPMTGRAVFEKTKSLIQKTEWDVMDARNSILFIEKDRKLRWSNPNSFIRDSQTYVELNAEDVVTVEVTLFKNDVGHTYRMDLNKAGNQFVEVSSGDDKNVSSSGVVTDQFVEQTVTEALEEELGLDKREIKPSSRIKTDLGADTADIAAIGAKIEQSFFANQVYVDSRKVDNVMGKITNTTTLQELCGFVKGAVSSAVVRTVNIPDNLNMLSLFNKFEDELAVAPYVVFMEKKEEGFHMYGEGYNLPISALDRDLADGQRIVFKLSTNEIVDIERKGSEAEIIIRTNGSRDIDPKVVADVIDIVEGKTLPIVQGKAQVVSSGLTTVPFEGEFNILSLVEELKQKASIRFVHVYEKADGLLSKPYASESFSSLNIPLLDGQKIKVDFMSGRSVEFIREAEAVKVAARKPIADSTFSSSTEADPETEAMAAGVVEELASASSGKAGSAIKAGEAPKIAMITQKIEERLAGQGTTLKFGVRDNWEYYGNDNKKDHPGSMAGSEFQKIPFNVGATWLIAFNINGKEERVKIGRTGRGDVLVIPSDPVKLTATEEIVIAALGELRLFTDGNGIGEIISFNKEEAPKIAMITQKIEERLAGQGTLKFGVRDNWEYYGNDNKKDHPGSMAGSEFQKIRFNVGATWLIAFNINGKEERVKIGRTGRGDVLVIPSDPVKLTATEEIVIAALGELRLFTDGSGTGSALDMLSRIVPVKNTDTKVGSAIAPIEVPYSMEGKTLDSFIKDLSEKSAVRIFQDNSYLTVPGKKPQAFKDLDAGSVFLRNGYALILRFFLASDNQDRMEFNIKFLEDKTIIAPVVGNNSARAAEIIAEVIKSGFGEKAGSAIAVKWNLYRLQSRSLERRLKAIEALRKYKDPKAVEAVKVFDDLMARIPESTSKENPYKKEMKAAEFLPQARGIRKKGFDFEINQWAESGKMGKVQRTETQTLYGRSSVPTGDEIISYVLVSSGDPDYTVAEYNVTFWDNGWIVDVPEKVEIVESKKISSSLGGISMDSANLNLQIKRDGNGIPLPVSEQPIEMMNIQGFSFTIMSITPVANLFLLSGLTDTGDSLSKKISEGIGQAMVADKRELSLKL